MNIPYVPSLVDHAAICSRMSESDCSIVIDSIDFVWTLIFRVPILAMLILFNHHSIANIVCVRSALRVFSLIVLLDEPLATLLNELPVSFKANVVNRITIEHKLHGRCTRGGVNCGSHREANG